VEKMALKLYNTATRNLETFTPPPPHEVTMYNCGPTVYNYAHIGNLRAYVFADVLRRTLELSGYTVKQIVNITDVGHLVSDADEGEDKIAVGAKREGKSVEEIIAQYSQAFYDDLKSLNILPAIPVWLFILSPTNATIARSFSIISGSTFFVSISYAKAASTASFAVVTFAASTATQIECSDEL
jgi:hypothetical protein